MRIFLADLGHNQLTISSDVYPLGVANLASYVTAHFRSTTKLEVSIFREPAELKVALDSVSPDILGLSGYSWNHQLSLSLARYARARSPGVLTLMGGPNYPLTAAEQEAFLREAPEIDVAVRGPTYGSQREPPALSFPDPLSPGVLTLMGGVSPGSAGNRRGVRGPT